MKTYIAAITDAPEYDSSEQLMKAYLTGTLTDDVFTVFFDAPDDNLATLVGHGYFWQHDYTADGTVSFVIPVPEGTQRG